ncbi:hypothetical protein NDU88_002136 [Pleurodeles waltl]|uniref:Uncharacterized protein n=1 Tax=Pleurodeles waltl TaxID=8319 RepID=A0AAV7VYG7_PLEWA|nr:hypothetical protein NDU88_002136 [Pleurodeles waltl]
MRPAARNVGHPDPQAPGPQPQQEAAAILAAPSQLAPPLGPRAQQFPKGLAPRGHTAHQSTQRDRPTPGAQGRGRENRRGAAVRPNRRSAPPAGPPPPASGSKRVAAPLAAPNQSAPPQGTWVQRSSKGPAPQGRTAR